METSYRIFRLQIKDMESISGLITRSDTDFETFTSKVQLPTVTEQTIDVLNQAMIEKRLTREEDFKVLGSHLYQTLFDKTADEKFTKEYDDVAKIQGAILRLELEFEPNAAKLAEWPWEYLHYPDDPTPGGRGGGFFIASEGELILTRRVPLDPIQLQPLCSPLRILFVVGSEPKGYSEIMYEDVIGAIKDLEADNPGLVTVNQLEEPTKDTLTQTVKTWKPHVVHYIGHGKYEEKGYLSWKNEAKPDDPWIDEDTWAGCFEDYRPRLVFLQACDSGRSDSYRGFKGVAYKLIYLKSRIPAVIAMQHRIAQGVGIRFAKTFYRLLVERKPIGLAVQLARKDVGKNYPFKLEDYSERGFGSPVLFLQAEGPIIEQIFEAGVNQEEIQPTQLEVVDCPYSLHSGYGCTGKVRLRPRQDKFCSTCHRPLQTCPSCGFIIGQYIGFCTECGFTQKKSEAPETKKPTPTDKLGIPRERPKEISGAPKVGIP